MRRVVATLGVVLFLQFLPASASETRTYTYDALGRVVEVERSGSVNDGVLECYTYDDADNRTNIQISGVSGSSTPCPGSAPSPTFAISNPAAVTEGGTLIYTVTKTNAGAANVNYATANGTATSGSDYTATSGTLEFATSDTSKTINVSTIDDSTSESDETVLVNLSSPTGGATITTSQATGTINDNDDYTRITDSSLNVLTAHTSTYFCDVWYDAPNDYYTEICELDSDNTVVYRHWDDPNEAYVWLNGSDWGLEYASGYSHGTEDGGYGLLVETQYYGDVGP